MDILGAQAEQLPVVPPDEWPKIPPGFGKPVPAPPPAATPGPPPWWKRQPGGATNGAALCAIGVVAACAIDEGTQIWYDTEVSADKSMRGFKKPPPCPPKNCKDHHIASPYKNDRLGLDMGSIFGGLLRQGGIDIWHNKPTYDGTYPSNGCPVCEIGDGRTHRGPHDPRYHQAIRRRLERAINGAKDKMPPGANRQDWIKRAIDQLFNQICKELNQPGNRLRDWVTEPIR